MSGLTDTSSPYSLSSAIEEIEIVKCACYSAAVQLLQCGLFPCAPIAPTLAVDIRMLDFFRRLFVQMSPNHTALAQALENCLAAQGYKLETKVGTRHSLSKFLLNRNTRTP